MGSPLILLAELRALNKNGLFAGVPRANSSQKLKAPKKARKAPYKTKALVETINEHPDDFDPTVRSQARFMKNIVKKDY
jgi:hypothetical protein